MLKYRFGTPLMIAHTAAADIAAGDVVAVNGVLCIAHQPILTGKTGRLAYPNGNCVYEVAKKTGAGEGFAFGDAAYWDDGNSRVQDDDASSTLSKIGEAVTNPDGDVAGDSDATIYIVHAA